MVKNLFRTLLSLSLAVPVFAGCLKSEDTTIALPEIGTAANVIPEEIRDGFELRMDIYEGTTPPDLTGDFLISPVKLSYASDGYVFQNSISDSYMSFYNKKGNTYEYRRKEGNSEGYSPMVTVIGSGNNFTAYFTEETHRDDGETWTRQATLLSGTLTANGIKDVEYAFIMLKTNDPNDIIMEENEYRIFYDGDGLAVRTDWNDTKSSHNTAGQSDSYCTSSAINAN